MTFSQQLEGRSVECNSKGQEENEHWIEWKVESVKML